MFPGWQWKAFGVRVRGANLMRTTSALFNALCTSVNLILGDGRTAENDQFY